MWSELDPENVMNAIKGWFPLSRNFQVPTQVNFTRAGAHQWAPDARE